MKNLLLLALFGLSMPTVAQINDALTGRWKTVSVTEAKRFAAYGADSIVLLDGTNRSKISEQDNKAGIRMTYAQNVFVFTADHGFFQYYTDNPRSIIFDGQYKIPQTGELILSLKNTAKIDVSIKAKYYFKDGKLYLKMYSNRNYPIDYILERVTE
jgi:hypothetical protein